MLIAGEIATQIQREIAFEEVHEGLEQYRNKMTAGKMLFVRR
jgi:hypothetical protein